MKSERAVNEIAVRQGGVVTRAQARRLGMTDRQITARSVSGDWERLAEGVFRLFPFGDALDVALGAAAVLPSAVLSHHTAAGIHGLRFVPCEPPSVTVHSQTTHDFPGAAVTRCFDLEEAHTEPFRWTRVTTVERTLMDLAPKLSDRWFAVVADDAIAAGTASMQVLAQVLESVARRGKPGVTTVRRYLTERVGDLPSTSALEQKANRLLTRAGLDGFVTECSIPWDPDRRFDVAFPDANLAIEWDSRRWHTTVEAFDRDRRRDRSAVLHGWRVLRFTWRDVTERPDQVVAEIASALSADSHSVG